MNILVVSLLRIGDVLLCVPTMMGLKKRYPEAKIHLLINRSSAGIVPLIPDLFEVHQIDRDALQESLVSRDRSFLEPFDRLVGMTELIGQKHFDLIVNLTHTRMSGWLMNLLDGKKKLGLEIQADGRPQFGNPWFQFLNVDGSESSERSFHFSDVFAFGSGIRQSDRRMKLQETVAGQAEATRLLSNIDHLIAVQPFTSDKKKTWPTAKWKRTIELIADVEPDFSFGILCGPGEQEAAMALVRSLKSKLIDAHILDCSLEGAFSILKRASLLITGDTSIKHMAAGAGLPIVELSIGSSSFERTGAYTDNVVILQAKQECAPCEHSSVCPFESPECHDKISAEAVALVSQTVLQRRWTDLRIVANEFSDSILFLRGDFSWEGEWRAVPLSQSFQGQLALEWIDRASQKLFLNGTHEAVLALGSEGVQVRRLFSEAYPQTLPADRMDVYRRLEVDLKTFKSELEAIASELKILVQNFQSLSGVDPLKKRIQKVVGMFGANVGFASYVNRLRELATEISESDNEFFQIRKSREILASQLQRVDIEQRLIATLRNQELEVL